MRVPLRLLIVLAASAAVSAQPADPNPAWAYDPIEVGNVRAYRQGTIVGSPTGFPFSRADSPAAVTVDGHRWVIRRTQRFRVSGPYGDYERAESRVLVRFDTTAANVVVRDAPGNERMLYPCRLDLPVPPDGEPAECEGGTYWVHLEDTARVGDEAVPTATRRFDGVVGGPTLAAGIGEVGRVVEAAGEVSMVYAVVGGDSLSSRPTAYPATAIDPMPGWRYYPLAVGNEWEYVYRQPENAEVRRRRVVGTAEVGGQTYFEVESARAPLRGGGWEILGTERLRYDTLSARVVDPEGWSLTPCPFDEPGRVSSDGPQVFCDPETVVEVLGPGSRRQETGLVVTSESVKRFVYYGLHDGYSPGSFAAGIGYLPDTAGSMSPVPSAGLSYAAVRQDDGRVLEIGARYPVAAGDGPEAVRLGVAVGPNPTAGPLAIVVSAPAGEAVTAEAFDALGRRVWRRDVPAGPGLRRLSVDASAWAPGLYVVRASGASGATSATVVRR